MVVIPVTRRLQRDMIFHRELQLCQCSVFIIESLDGPRKHVIHTVGPIYSERDRERCAELLASCYKRSLEVAAQNSLAHIVSSTLLTCRTHP